MADTFDLTVIGSGPAGYVAAIRAAQLGMRVAVVEKWPTFGGTCLNIGCIPSKALLHASELYAEAGEQFSQFGIDVAPRLNLGQMMTHKATTVTANVSGVEFLFKKNKITTFRGAGSITAPGKVLVTAENGSTQAVDTRNIVIASGSVPASLPGIAIDEERIVTSTGALSFKEVPTRLLVIGGGIIGLELGSVWSRLGSKVTVVEFLDRILVGLDGEAARQTQRALTKQGLESRLGTKVTSIENRPDGSLMAHLEAVNGSVPAATLDVDAVLVAVGRKPYTEGLGLDRAGVALDERGRIRTDAQFRTNVPGIYAIGDVIAGPMLAHKGMDEGHAVAEIIAGQHPHVNYGAIPSVMYTSPEVAWIGKSEEELKSEGIDYKAGKFPFTANGRAKAMLATQGYVKILADVATDRVLGAQIIARNAGEMIHEIAVLMEFSGSAEDLARTTHAHPTLSEAIKEAALMCGDGAIHI